MIVQIAACDGTIHKWQLRVKGRRTDEKQSALLWGALYITQLSDSRTGNGTTAMENAIIVQDKLTLLSKQGINVVIKKME